MIWYFFFFSSRRRHTKSKRDWSSDVCSSDLTGKNRTGVIPAPAVSPVIGMTPVRFFPVLSAMSCSTQRPNEIGRASCRERVEGTGETGTQTGKKLRSERYYQDENFISEAHTH